MKLSSNLLCPIIFSLVQVLGKNSLQAQVFVGDAGGGSGYVNEYSPSGTIEDNPLLRTGNDLQGLAIAGNNLYTADFYDGTIGEYNASTGAPIAATLISAPRGSYGVAVANGLIYVSNYYGTLTAYTPLGASVWSVSGLGTTGDVVVSGLNAFVVHASGDNDADTISEYNALTGTPEVATLVSGLYDTFGLAVSNNELFVSSYAGGTIGEYGTDGTTVNSALVNGVPDGAGGLAVLGSTIYIADLSNVRMYSVGTGAYLGSTTTGLLQADSVAVVPEPNALSLLILGLVVLIHVRRKVPC